MSCRDGFVTRMAEGERSVQMLACNKFSSSRALVPFKVPYFFSLILPLVLFKNYKPYLSLLSTITIKSNVSNRSSSYK